MTWSHAPAGLHSRSFPLLAFAVGVLALMSCGGFEYLVFSAGEDARRYADAGGMAVYSSLRLALAGLVALLLVPHLRRASLMALWPLMPFYLWLALSPLFSQAPEESLAAFYRLSLASLPGLWVAMGQSRAIRMERLGQGAAFIVFCTLAALLIAPDLAFMEGRHAGAFRGPFHHKNVLGITLCFAAFIALARAMDTGRTRWWLLLLSCLSGVVLSHSAAAMVFCALGLALAFILAVLGSAAGREGLRPLLVLLGIVSLGLLPLAGDLVPAIVEALGREATMTGREQIWAALMARADASPLAGHGLGVHAASALAWIPAHGHSGYLDALLGLGWIGLVLLALPFAIVTYRAISVAGSDDPLGTRYFPLAALVVLALYNGVETLVPHWGTLAPSLLIALCALTAPGKTEQP